MHVLHEPTTTAFKDIVASLSEADTRNTRNGATKENLMVAVQSDDPRDRWLMRENINWAFGLQECFAYWNGLNPGYVERYNTQMEEYMYNNKLHGSAYGRYFRELPNDQIERVITQLQTSEHTRRAVINLHNSFVEDYDGPDVACTVYLQFFIRDNELHLTANMRSQDMLFGYPYDTQAFQWLQEVIAGILDVDLGTYTHIMGSCHYYTDFEEQILDTISHCTSYRMPDCTLMRGELGQTMNAMSDALSRIRDGDVPHTHILDVARTSQFYAEWLMTMAAYEQLRFHDNSREAKSLKQHLDIEPFIAFVEQSL